MPADSNINDLKARRDWFALYTRPRFEKKVDRQLKELKIESYLPLKKEVKYWSDRKKVIDEPLFPSYVFIRANLKERHNAFQPQGVVRLVSFNGEATRIPDEQIEAVRRILDSGFTPVVNHDFAMGDPVEVIAGPLIGLRGRIAAYRGNSHFSIQIDGIRQSLAVRIEAGYLKPLNKHA